MRRSRATSVSLGLLVLLINVAIVVAVVSFTGGRSEPPDNAASKKHTGTPAPTAGRQGSGGATTEVSGLVPADKDLTLAVLGDGTGDEKGEWVTVLGELLGADHRAVVRGLDPSDPTRYKGKLEYGSNGRQATIWNGSRRGASANYAADRLGFLVPSTPDAVLLSYGRDDRADEIGAKLQTTLDALRRAWPKVPVVVVLQAPDRDDAIAPVREAADAWATEHGLTTIDIAAAFRKAGDPNSFVSIVDPPSVNAAGGRLWAETVFRALGGELDTAAPSDSSATGTGGAAVGDAPAPAADGPISGPVGGRGDPAPQPSADQTSAAPTTSTTATPTTALTLTRPPNRSPSPTTSETLIG